jgi:hypothetical protein
VGRPRLSRSAEGHLCWLTRCPWSAGKPRFGRSLALPTFALFFSIEAVDWGGAASILSIDQQGFSCLGGG